MTDGGGGRRLVELSDIQLWEVYLPVDQFLRIFRKYLLLSGAYIEYAIKCERFVVTQYHLRLARSHRCTYMAVTNQLLWQLRADSETQKQSW